MGADRLTSSAPRVAESPAADAAFVRVHDARPDGYDGTCLRPLGLCELGGCCEVCWYRPGHPRFERPAD